MQSSFISVFITQFKKIGSINLKKVLPFSKTEEGTTKKNGIEILKN